MKLRTTLALVLAVGLFASAVMANAQAKPGRPQRATNETTQNRKKGGAPNDANHQLLMAAAKDCQAAQRAMQKALPIYHGHRHRAMEINRVTLMAIRAAFKWRPGEASNAARLTQSLAKLGDGGEGDASKYSAEQIGRSNELMKRALASLKKAQSELAQVTIDYGGYVSTSKQLVAMSIDEVLKAGQSLGGRP
ncbi:MAG: hypothetical protein JSS66_02670 [Armatimonadetes bacterium]|nr:hypothetical protein [Armatimonadota bacterium]